MTAHRITPAAAISPFRVVMIAPIRDGRDGICGERTYRDDEGGHFETYQGAKARAWRLGAEYHNEDVAIEIRDAAGAWVLPDSPPAPAPQDDDGLPF
jgi:hypothetical protein